MASKIDTVGVSLPTVKEKTRAVSSLRFDWIMVIVSVWWLGGLFIDGWAHSNIPQLETFFTPWHAVFYSGYLAVAFTLLIQILLNLRQSALNAGGNTPSLVTLVRESLPGNRWLQAIPICRSGVRLESDCDFSCARSLACFLPECGPLFEVRAVLFLSWRADHDNDRSLVRLAAAAAAATAGIG